MATEGNPDRAPGLSSRPRYRHGVTGRAGQEARDTGTKDQRTSKAGSEEVESSLRRPLRGGRSGRCSPPGHDFAAAATSLAAGSFAIGMLADPMTLSEPRIAARCAIRARTSGHIERPRNTVRRLLERRRKAHVLRGILRLRLPLLQGEQPNVDRLVQEERACASFIASSDFRPGQRHCRATSLRRPARSLREFHDICGRPAVPRRKRRRGVAGRRHRARRPKMTGQSRPNTRNFQLAGQFGATGTPLFVIGDRVMNGAVGYDALKKAVADARAKELGGSQPRHTQSAATAIPSRFFVAASISWNRGLSRMRMKSGSASVCLICDAVFTISK